MRNLLKIFLLNLFVLSSVHFAHAKQAPFVLITSHKRVILKDSLETIQVPSVLTSGNALIISDSGAYFIVTTGPDEDMLSYRIHGFRNPKLVMRAGLSLHILFVNTDGDMQHDIRVGAEKGPFPCRLTFLKQ